MLLPRLTGEVGNALRRHAVARLRAVSEDGQEEINGRGFIAENAVIRRTVQIDQELRGDDGLLAVNKAHGIVIENACSPIINAFTGYGVAARCATAALDIVADGSEALGEIDLKRRCTELLNARPGIGGGDERGQALRAARVI